jgi:ribosomal protein L7/L12
MYLPLPAVVLLCVILIMLLVLTFMRVHVRKGADVAPKFRAHRQPDGTVPPGKTELPLAVQAEVAALLAQDRITDAVKHVREATGRDMHDAKAIVDAIEPART